MSLTKTIANIIINDLLKHSKRIGCKVGELGFTPNDIWWLAMLVEYEVLDRTKATKVINGYMTTPNSIKGIITKLDLWPKFDNSDLDKIVDFVMNGNPEVVQEIQNGKNKAIGFLIGKLKQIDNNVDTKEAIELIKAKLC